MENVIKMKEKIEEEDEALETVAAENENVQMKM